ncbi:MAG: Mrp/NBP35 family ATP-binding protein [Rhodospirillales bacterium]|nr:Mrp/NBP35 family ATP-binding protein [Rhodospirillales bacterium]MDE0380899.1 Mrp/NBP35 family ATP-binding protein [Rhodospirillales bacterium]
MASVTKDQVLAALADILDPDTGQSIVAGGLISGVVVRDGNVGFTLEVDPARGAAMEPLRKACEAAVERLSGVLSVTAVMTAERQAGGRAQDRAQGHGQAQGHAHGHAHGGQAQAAGAQQAPELLPGVKSVIAVASGKGGVGKSTTAVNIATAMAARNVRVGLLDCDIYGPSIPRMLNLSGQPEMAGERTLRPMANYGIKCMSIGFLVAEDTAMIWRGPMVMQALEQMMRDVEWGALDVLICDLPPGTGDAQLTMAQRVPLTGAVIVSTPQDIALLDVTRGINMFQQVNVPIFGVVENMSYYVCPQCGHRAELFHHGGARETAHRLGVDFLGEIPLDLDIRTTSDAGRPIVVTQPESPHAGAYRQIASALIDKAASALGGAGRPQPRIVMM